MRYVKIHDSRLSRLRCSFSCTEPREAKEDSSLIPTDPNDASAIMGLPERLPGRF